MEERSQIGRHLPCGLPCRKSLPKLLGPFRSSRRLPSIAHTTTQAAQTRQQRPVPQLCSSMSHAEQAPTPPSILYQNCAKTLVLLDLPSSIEESQTLSGDERRQRRRLFSTPPPVTPFHLPEPRDGSDGSENASAAAQVTSLMTKATVERALDELKSAYSGPWCLPRMLGAPPPRPAIRKIDQVAQANAGEDGSDRPDYFIPEAASYLLGSIETKRADFLASAPLFDLIIIDPPWPNRSARRNKRNNGYRTADNIDEITSLLSLIPVASNLAANGAVAVWVTNNQAFVDLLRCPGGIFDRWGVNLVQESIWLKIAANGEPVFAVNSTWRKPWERLLIARPKRSQDRRLPFPEIMVAVPDVHSRKPNLRFLFGECGLPDVHGGLEVFARNLTAGWWSWGSEVLLFQTPEHWVNDGEDVRTRTNTVV
jgi:N6-adenosine-specific RNA methylase IME4